MLLQTRRHLRRGRPRAGRGASLHGLLDVALSVMRPARGHVRRASLRRWCGARSTRSANTSEPLALPPDPSRRVRLEQRPRAGPARSQHRRRRSDASVVIHHGDDSGLARPDGESASGPPGEFSGLSRMAHHEPDLRSRETQRWLMARARLAVPGFLRQCHAAASRLPRACPSSEPRTRAKSLETALSGDAARRHVHALNACAGCFKG